MKIRSESAAQTRQLASEVGALLERGDLVLLVGELGSGKTTFAQGLAQGLGVTEPVTSPTFTLVHEYEGRVPVAHVDVYRLDRVQELHDLGLEELVDSARVTMVEWGDVVAQALPGEHMTVRLDSGDTEGDRTVTIELHGPRWHGRRSRLDRSLAIFPTVRDRSD
jgi:tRNA threonylcarbamoyladenosine biosynthesis protein TsaE